MPATIPPHLEPLLDQPIFASLGTIRPDGTVQVAHDIHTLGLFPRETWLRVLAEVGFEARAVAEVTNEDRLPREFFVGRRPG